MGKSRRPAVLAAEKRGPTPDRLVPVMAPQRLAGLVREIVAREASGEGLVDILRALVPGLADGAAGPSPDAPPSPGEAPAGGEGPPDPSADDGAMRLAAARAELERSREQLAAAEAAGRAARIEIQTAAYAAIDARRTGWIRAGIAAAVFALAGLGAGIWYRAAGDERLAAIQRLEVQRALRDRDRAQDVLIEALDRIGELEAAGGRAPRR